MNEFNAKAANPSCGAKSMELRERGSQYDCSISLSNTREGCVCGWLGQTIALIYKTYIKRERTTKSNQFTIDIISIVRIALNVSLYTDQ